MQIIALLTIEFDWSCKLAEFACSARRAEQALIKLRNSLLKYKNKSISKSMPFVKKTSSLLWLTRGCEHVRQSVIISCEKVIVELNRKINMEYWIIAAQSGDLNYNRQHIVVDARKR